MNMGRPAQIGRRPVILAERERPGMNSPLVVLTRNPELLLQLGQRLEGKYTVLPCESLTALPERLKTAQQVHAVLVHLDRQTLNGHSPARFAAELDEVVADAPLYGLLDPSCPPRLRKLAERTVEVLLPLPLDYGRLETLLTTRQDLEAELEALWRQLPHKELHGKTRSLVTFTPAMFEMIDELKVAARHSVTVLLIGETGCGKTFLARLIHELSDRRDERFCTVACGALPPDLIESELFGYVKGAFTGADRDREGKFAAAGRGTLLLDEIDVLPLDQQAKLLRVIETGEFEPVGSNETQFSQARLIVASNYNLEELVRAGRFRTDLYYRLNILNFRLLPLRERPWDIEYLARKFALDHSRTHGIPLRAIEPDFLTALRAYPWPGNVREMENVIRRAVLYCHRGVLSVQDLPSTIRHAVGVLPPGEGALVATGPTTPSPAPSPPATPPLWQAAAPAVATAPPAAPPAPPVPTAAAPAHQLHPPLPPRAPASPLPVRRGFPRSLPASRLPEPPLGEPLVPAGSAPPHDFGDPLRRQELAVQAATSSAASLEARVDLLERRIIEDCLQRNNYRRKETAAELGISRVTLYNKMKKFGLM
jgi:DNA-binding NtrC family response regulator